MNLKNFLKPLNTKVDLYDNYGSHWPLFVVGISLVQMGCFAYWVGAKEGVGSLSAYSPVSGPEWAWLRLVSDFPSCESWKMQPYRMLTYQVITLPTRRLHEARLLRGKPCALANLLFFEPFPDF